MREFDLIEQLNPVFGSPAQSRRGPFPDAIGRQDGSILKRRGEKGTGSMGLMVFGEDYSAAKLTVQLLLDLPR